MLAQFLSNLRLDCGAQSEHKLLLACSGGVDSMVLATLLMQANQPFAVAHCNFKLRDDASDGDETFVKKWAEEHNIPFFVKRFDTKELKLVEKLSTQMLARKLRYDWFDELLQEQQFDFLLTAHHLDDSVETFFINLNRGSGLAGLTGIAHNNKVLRPLFNFTKAELTDFAQENGLLWREDASNDTDAYLRNKLRHHLVPQLIQWNEGFYASFLQSTKHIKEAHEHLQRYYAQLVAHCRISENVFDAKKLHDLPERSAVLHYLFKDHGISKSQLEQLGGILLSKEQKIFELTNCMLLLSRGKLIFNLYLEKEPPLLWYSLEDIIQSGHFKTVTIEAAGPIKLALKNQNSPYRSAKYALLDWSKITFPMHLDYWKEGDFFYPLGLKGRKLLSDYYTDQKMDALAKQNQAVLRCGNNIVWVVGKRIDQRYSIKSDTERILCLEID